MSDQAVGIRQLRDNLAEILRRAEGGERVVISSGGRPVAQLGPLEPAGEVRLDDLVAAGLLTSPMSGRLPRDLEPTQIAIDQDAREVLDDLRGRQ